MTDTQLPAGAPRRDERGGPDQLQRQPAVGDPDPATLVGIAAVVFPLVYFASEVMEVAQGKFSTVRLALAYIGEAGIPLVVIGLYAVQRPRIGRLGLYGALAYAYSFMFFASTVVYALAAGSRNWTAVTRVFGGWLTLHGAIMVTGGSRVRLGRHQDRGPAPLDRGLPDGRGRVRGGRRGNVRHSSCRGGCPAAGGLRRHGRDGAAGTLANAQAACDPHAITQRRTTDTKRTQRSPAAAGRPQAAAPYC